MLQDFQSLGIHPSCWLRPQPMKSMDIVLPRVPWVMPKEKQPFFLDTMANLKVPTGFASSFKNHVVKGKLGSMKSHDYHVLFQSIFPLCMQHIMIKEP